MRNALILLSFIIQISVSAQTVKNPPFLNSSAKWIDSVYNKLSTDEKIAQLFIVEVGNEEDKFAQTVAAVQKYKPGCVIFFANSAINTANRANKLQAISKVPLLTSIDGEWGLSMRLSNTMGFPVAMALGAVQDNSLLYEMGKEMAYQALAVGINYNLAPDVDVNNNAANPVINYRSFGENPEQVAQKGLQVMLGMQAGGILTSAKHFPGHGDTDIDSHYSLPIISHPYSRLKKVELYPFSVLINNGVSSIMTAHLHVPALDAETNRSATLSPNIIKGLLRDTLGFKGLVITDALNMKGVAEFYKPGEVEVMALQAGADLLLMPDDAGVSLAAIKKAISEGKLSMNDINEKCKKILQAKYWLHLNELKPVTTQNLEKKLFRPQATVLQDRLFRESITLVKNDNNLVPLKNISANQYVALALGRNSVSFHQELNKYKVHKTLYLDKGASEQQVANLEKELAQYNQVIVSLHKLWLVAKEDYGISKNEIRLLNYLASKGKNVIFVLFGNPYTLKEFEAWKKFQSVIVTYQENSITQSHAAQLIYGAIQAKGKLPVSIDNQYKAGHGLHTAALGRLRYGVPAEEGFDAEILYAGLDSLANLGIKEGAFPGCQVLVARNGNVVMHKSYGFLTYDAKEVLTNEHIFDLASVTKVTASLPALIYFDHKQKFSVYDRISDYYKPWRKNNKHDIRFIDALTHQARLTPWIPFYKETSPFGLFRQRVFSAQKSKKYALQVANGMYEHRKFPKTIYKRIDESPLLEKSEMRYSDLSFYVYPKLIEEWSEISFEDFLQTNFYKPLGMDNTFFNAHLHADTTQIVPTELDTFFRMQVLRGFVHDEGAALLNGISGHAGLFSTANDLAKLMQLYLNEGQYGGEEYFADSVFRKYYSRPFAAENNRKGIGFDKPYLGNQQKELINAYPAPSCSENSYGHGGFTGTFVWVDPDNELIFIFLSNRVYPTRENGKLYQLNIRPAMHQVVYDAMEKVSE